MVKVHVTFVLTELRHCFLILGKGILKFYLW